MWAQRLVAPGRLEMVEAQDPAPGDLVDGEVLLRTLAGAVCGSDLPYFRGHPPPHFGTYLNAGMVEVPGFPMHEVVGEVVASRSPRLEVGARVVGWASAFNGLAEYVVCRAEGLATYDASLAPTDAVMLQPLACVLDAVMRLPDLTGRHVTVLGLGPIGLLFGHVLRSRGAGRIDGVDLVPRDDLATEFGFDDTLRVSSGRWAAELPEDSRPDVVIEAVGHQQGTLGHAVDAVRDYGLVYGFGIPDDIYYATPMQSILRKNLTLMAGFTTRKQEALAAANTYLARHPDLPARYVTHRFPKEAATQAFEAAGRPAPGQVKVVLDLT